MARRKLPEELPIEGFNMTPMIDCTFQLIIFFMLVNDMSRVQSEREIVLPTASKAVKEKVEEPGVLVVNVMHDGTVRVGGQTFWRPKDGDNNRKLEELFASRRQNRQLQEVPGKAEWVRYPVLIRADRSTPFEHVQKVLTIATLHGGVTRVQLGAKQETAP